MVATELLLVCTTLGWGPTLPSGDLPPLPPCLPNVCPNLLDKRIKQGEWECVAQNQSRTCKNHRVGEVCSLKCQGSYKVSKPSELLC